MKLFFIADIHGHAGRLKMALDACEREQADRLVILGDILYSYTSNADEDAAAALFNHYTGAVSAVSGNCDHAEELSRLWFPVADNYLELEADGRQFFLTHGHRYGPGRIPPLAPGTILCFGHHHVPYAERSGNIILFSPGSTTLPRQGSAPGYGVYADGRLRCHNLLTHKVVAEISC
jgi:putative phosphoesterase